MGFGARCGRSAALWMYRAVAAALALSIAQSVVAAPAQLTGKPIDARLGFGPVTVNLRALGVVTGSKPLELEPATGFQVYRNGNRFTAVQATRVGNVCMTLNSFDFVPGPNDVLEIDVGVSNREGKDGPVRLRLTGNAGPTVNPQDPACLDANSAPTADAGGDRTVADADGAAGETVPMTGSASDPDGGPLTFQWYLAGQPVQGATALNSSLRLADGPNDVMLRATDADGATADGRARITVQAPTAPSANAGPDQSLSDTDGQAGESVTLSGSATGAPTSISRFEWFDANGAPLGTGATLTRRLPDGINDIQLRVTYVTGLTVTDNVRITIAAPPPVNRPPIANAGPDQTIPDRDGAAGESVTLDASGSSDPDGSIVSYTWTIPGRAPATSQQPTLATTLPNGVTNATLTVTDNAGATATDTVQITVSPPVNRAPIANAGADRTIADTNGAAGESVTLDGSGSSDPDGSIVSYTWAIPGRSPVTSQQPTLVTTLPNGVTTATLTVTDNGGATATDAVQITVNAPVAPVANAGPDQSLSDTDGEDGEQVQLNGGQSSDADGTIANFAWSLGGQSLGQGPTLAVTLPNGSHTVTLTVRDNVGLTDTDTVLVTVAAPPRPPTANPGQNRVIPDSDGDPGERVTLDGSRSTDSDGSIVKWEWYENESLIGTGRTLQVDLDDGQHSIDLIVTDNAQLTDSATVNITVTAPNTSGAQPPTIDAGQSGDVPDTDGVSGESVTLSATASDPDGGTLTYIWLLGDSVLGNAATLTNVFLPDGRNDIYVEVTDDTGLTANDTVTLTVGAPRAPTANAGADQTLSDTDGAAGEDVTLSGSGTDQDGQITRYEWLLATNSLGTGQTLQTRLPNGSNIVTLRVTDNSGLTATDTVTISVSGSTSQAPTANAGPDQTLSDTDGAAGEGVTLSGSGTDADGQITQFEWLLGANSLGTGPTLQTRLPNGSNIVTLRVTDNSGLTATDTVTIDISATSRAPTVNAGADQSLSDADGQPGETVTFTGSATDDGTIVSYQWFIGDTDLGTGATLQARVPDGVTVVSLVVIDSSGLTASDTVQITVAAPVLPIVSAGLARTVEDTDVQAGEDVQLTGSATTSAGTITQYQWLLGNNILGTGQTITARLPDGANLVTLRATSSLGLVGSASVQITVNGGVRTVLANLPGLTPNERRLAAKLDEACNNVLGPIAQTGNNTAQPDDRRGAPSAQKGRAPTQAEVTDFQQKCRGLLISRNSTQLANAMGALLGDDFAVARTQTLLFANTQYAGVMDRLIALRGGAKGLSLAGLNIIVDGEVIPLAELQDLAKQLLGGGASSDADSLWSDKWGLWARGNYSFGEKDEDSLSPSFDAEQYALLAGLDYRLTQNAVIGGALAYGNSTVEFNPSSEGSLDTESWAISLYGSMYAKKNFYFDAILNVADASYDANRNITYVDGYGLVSTDASGDSGGMTLSGGLSGGYDFLVGGLTVSPTLGVFYIDAQIDEFTETGAGGLNLIYDEQKFKSLTGTVGVRMTFAWNLPFGVILPHLRADFVREFEDDVDVFGIRFAADPNAASTPPILVETENPDSSYWRFAGGFSAQFPHGISGYVEYQRLESFQLISFQDISVGLRFQAAF